jgi:hypothetical protein
MELMSCHVFFSGGVDINVIKNESVEVPETGKVGGGVGRMEEDQIGNQIETEVGGMDFRGNEQDVTKESLEGGNISTVLVKTEKGEDGDEDDEEEDDSDENDDDDDDDEEEEEDDGGNGNGHAVNDKRRKILPSNSSEMEPGETKKFKEGLNEKPEVV